MSVDGDGGVARFSTRSPRPSTMRSRPCPCTSIAATSSWHQEINRENALRLNLEADVGDRSRSPAYVFAAVYAQRPGEAIGSGDVTSTASHPDRAVWNYLKAAIPDYDATVLLARGIYPSAASPHVRDPTVDRSSFRQEPRAHTGRVPEPADPTRSGSRTPLPAPGVPLRSVQRSGGSDSGLQADQVAPSIAPTRGSPAVRPTMIPREPKCWPRSRKRRAATPISGVLMLPPDSHVTINALQRNATVGPAKIDQGRLRTDRDRGAVEGATGHRWGLRRNSSSGT